MSYSGMVTVSDAGVVGCGCRNPNVDMTSLKTNLGAAYRDGPDAQLNIAALKTKSKPGQEI